MTKKAKKMRGKSPVSIKSSPYKPTLYLDSPNIPNGLSDVKPGSKVDLTIPGRVIKKAEGLKGAAECSIEMDKVAMTPKGKGRK